MIDVTIQFVLPNADTLVSASPHGITTGMIVGVTCAPKDTMPGGLSRIAVYVARAVSATVLSLHVTPAAAAAGTSAIDITSEGSGEIHVIRLPVSARVVRAVAARVASVVGINQVQLLDSRGNRMQHLDAIVIPTDSEDELLQGGNVGTIRTKLPILIVVILRPDEASPMDPDTLRDLWKAAVRDAVLVNANMVESTGVILTSNIGPSGVNRPPIVTGQAMLEMQIEIWAEFANAFNDSYTIRY